MLRLARISLAVTALTTALSVHSAQGQTNSALKGIFEGMQDIGAPSHAGGLDYDPAAHTYHVTGGGANMWSTNDAFYFVWRKVNGDVSLTADIAFAGAGGDPHRKACLVVRQSLDGDSVYADAALHGSGLASLQCRDAKGEVTREVQSNVNSPKRLRIEKRGNYVSMSVAGEGESLHPAGGSMPLALNGTYYLGLGVCAHNDAVTEQAAFSNVQFKIETPRAVRRTLVSAIEIVPIKSQDRRVVYWATNQLQGPTWSPDGGSLFYNDQGRGRIYRLPLKTGQPELVNTGFAVKCDSDHGVSPDGKLLAISDTTQPGGSLIYTVPVTGGEPVKVTAQGPSFWHGWSPDGKTITYCAQRNGDYDVFTIPATGGDETRLTTAKGLDDAPEYSPDGKFIYFNSERSGSMQVWRMKPDGSNQEPVTSDDYNNWFPHPSPDGKWLLFLSYDHQLTGHPDNQNVTLRLMPLDGGKIVVLAKLFGGQGTINAPCWSPDSKEVAFTSYQFLP